MLLDKPYISAGDSGCLGLSHMELGFALSLVTGVAEHLTERSPLEGSVEEGAGSLAHTVVPTHPVLSAKRLPLYASISSFVQRCLRPGGPEGSSPLK